MAIAGTTIHWPWEILKAADSLPLTGMTSPADITFSLYRDTGSAVVAASETVTMTEVGVTGMYDVAFTPINSGLYALSLLELNVLTLQRKFRQDFLVLPAGAVFSPSYANAYCAESDIESALGLSISSSTNPNDTQTIGYAQGRADYLEAVLARFGLNVTPLTVTAGSVLEGILRRANAVGAAIDYLIAQGKYATPMEPGKIGSLQRLWEELVGYYANNGEWVDGVITTEAANTTSLATNHTLSGDTIARDNSSPPQDVGSQITMDMQF